MIGALVGIALVVLAHEAGLLAVGRMLGAARFHPAFPSLVEVTAPTRGKRALVLAGGVATAYLGLATLAFVHHLVAGIPFATGVAVGDVIPGYDAETKLVAGDRIATVDGEPLDLENGPSLSERVNRKAGAPIVLGIVRDGAPREVTLTPKPDRDRWLLGIRPIGVLDTRTDIGVSARLAVAYPLEQAIAIIGGLYRTITGSERADPGGPVRMVEEFRPAGPPPVLKLAMLVGSYVLLVLAVVDLLRLVPRPRR